MIDATAQKRYSPAAAYSQTRRNHWDRIASGGVGQKSLGSYYHRQLVSLYRYNISPNQRILELGCGTGDLIASLCPSEGVGVDFSAEMLRTARNRYPGITFIQADVHGLELGGEFDVIILSDLVNDLWDVQAVFTRLKHYTSPRTRIYLNFYSYVWELPLNIAQKLGLKTPLLPQNWLTIEDVTNLLELSGFQVIKHTDEILLPLPLWPLSSICNRWLAKIAPFRYADLTHFMIARPYPQQVPTARKPLVSVIVPVRNEEGNIPAIFERVPQMGGGTELIFVEGGSSDDTWGVIQRSLPSYPSLSPRAFQQQGKGKGDAVRLGFAEAHGDILMILDADLTVAPEDLPRFYDAISTGKGEFINGVRLVYPMEEKAMRLLNLFGNKFFSLAFSWLLGQPIKDTLCGTKVLWKHDYLKIMGNRSYFGDFDPFGDFDLLFGAFKLNLKYVEVPIRYRERTYGETNIHRFRHGILLFKMLIFAARRIKFI